MLTSSKQAGSGAVFHLAPPNSDFNKVYRNNMDIDSYVGVGNLIESALSQTDTALFESEGTIDYSKQYKNCQVFMHHILLYFHNLCSYPMKF